MTFSIVIPMFNASETIIGALDSCINQTYLPKEIILVDDYSTDDSIAVVKQWKKMYEGNVKIVLDSLPSNSGPSSARNRGWKIATGDFIAFLDADDWFISTKLEEVYKVLENRNNIVLLFHDEALDEEICDKAQSVVEKVSLFSILLINPYVTPACIVRRVINECFDETMRYTEDHDLWLRVTEKYNESYHFNSVLTILGREKLTEGGQSSNIWAMRKGELYMYYKFCKKNIYIVFLPALLGYSLSKHAYKLVKSVF